MKRIVGGIVLLSISGLIAIWAFSHIAVAGRAQAFDWKIFWGATHNLTLDYSSSELLYNPPWILALLWPLTIWPFHLSFALSCLINNAVLLVSVPTDKGRLAWLFGILVLLLSYPAVRHFLEGNLEAFMIAGALLLAWALKHRSAPGLAFAALLLCAKVQESWLLFIALAIYLWRNWPLTRWMRAADIAIAAALPFLLWRGSAWFEAATDVTFTWTNSSLIAVLGEHSVSPWLIAALWALIFLSTLLLLWPRLDLNKREQIALLMAASLWLSPYASNLSILTPMAVGLIPWAQRGRGRLLAVFALLFVPYLLFQSMSLRIRYDNLYGMLILAFSWAVLLGSIYQDGDPGPERALAAD